MAVPHALSEAVTLLYKQVKQNGKRLIRADTNTAYLRSLWGQYVSMVSLIKERTIPADMSI